MSSMRPVIRWICTTLCSIVVIAYLCVEFQADALSTVTSALAAPAYLETESGYFSTFFDPAAPPPPAPPEPEKVIMTGPELVIADFERNTYNENWSVAGNAFGTGPAQGTLPGQMAVEGYVGSGLANSFVGGDTSTGTLTSPPIRVRRPFINFLIGGGGWEGETCINLLLNGEVVRTATGPNRNAGGSERLSWQGWDVSEFAGQVVVIEIVDRAKGGWGHINVDQIVMSEERRGDRPTSTEIEIENHYLHFPVTVGNKERRVKCLVDGKVVRDFTIELADGPSSLVMFSDVREFIGNKMVIQAELPPDSTVLQQIVVSAEIPSAGGMYHEAGRPQVHFTSRRGWLNDPNGLVYFNGEYHLFYQHNPYGWNWGNMHWGHAVSKDMLQWREVGIALRPKEFGDWAFSGSAVIDTENTSGFGKDAMVAAYTSTGRGECIVYSTDKGRTWTEFDQNPVVVHNGRDPRLLWHAESQQWVMVLYDEPGPKQQDITFFTSPDLKNWMYRSRLEGFFECPDLVKLAVDGDAAKSMWMVYGANAEYLLGSFDGAVFTPDRRIHPEGKKLKLWHDRFYAAQTVSHMPDGRCVQIGWGQVSFPGMPFNQQMAIPVELTLRTTATGPRLFAEPIREIAELKGDSKTVRDLAVKGFVSDLGELSTVANDAFEVRAVLDTTPEMNAGFSIGGRNVAIMKGGTVLQADTDSYTLPAAENGRVALQLIVDRGSIEVFVNNGAAAFSLQRPTQSADAAFKVFASGEGVAFRELTVTRLKSVWTAADAP